MTTTCDFCAVDLGDDPHFIHEDDCVLMLCDCDLTVCLECCPECSTPNPALVCVSAVASVGWTAGESVATAHDTGLSLLPGELATTRGNQ